VKIIHKQTQDAGEQYGGGSNQPQQNKNIKIKLLDIFSNLTDFYRKIR